MPGNMKCGRLRSSNCFVVFFPLFEFSPLVFLRSSPILFFPFLCRAFRPILLSPMYSATYSDVQRRTSTYATARVALCSLLFLRLSDFYFVFPDFFIDFLPYYSFFSRFSTASLCLCTDNRSKRDSLTVSTITFSLFNFFLD